MVELEVSLRDQSLEPVQGVKAIEEFIGMLVIDNDLKKSVVFHVSFSFV